MSIKFQDLGLVGTDWVSLYQKEGKIILVRFPKVIAEKCPDQPSGRFTFDKLYLEEHGLDIEDFIHSNKAISTT
jgi:hypothetical protein